MTGWQMPGNFQGSITSFDTRMGDKSGPQLYPQCPRLRRSLCSSTLPTPTSLRGFSSRTWPRNQYRPAGVWPTSRRRRVCHRVSPPARPVTSPGRGRPRLEVPAPRPSRGGCRPSSTPRPERLLGNCCVRTVRGRQSEPALIRESPPGEQADRRVCSPVPPAADRTATSQLCR